MRMINELNPLFLYPSTSKIYAPIDPSDKRRGAAILLLTPNIESSIELSKLPYMHNGNLFTSFYIDRDPIGLINNKATQSIIDGYDENEAKSLSEAMIMAAAGSTKFKFDDKTSMMDEQYIRDVYNSRIVKFYAKQLNIPKVPDKINVVVHPNVTHLRKNPPKYIKFMDDDYYSYFDKDTIHVVSKMVYDPESMRGNYDTYLLIELLYAIMISYNKDLHFIPAMGIAMAIANLPEYADKTRDNRIDGGKPFEFASSISSIIKRTGYKTIHQYIRTNDMSIFAKYTMSNIAKNMSKAIFEADLSYYDRQHLLPSDFGVPEKRKYPIHDEDHVRAAIRLFNNCDPDDEKQLAEAIIKRMKRFGITDVKVSASNRFSRYYHPKNRKHIHEGQSYNSGSGFRRKPFNKDCTHSEFECLNNVDVSDPNRCGEVFIDDDGNLAAYYMTDKDEEGNVWITDMKCYNGDGYSFLIGAAMDYQNADFARTNDNHMYEKLKQFGFKDMYDDNGMKMMTIRESSYDLECNWQQVKYICSTLSDEELRRITFSDTYEDSKFVIKRIIARVGNSNTEFTGSNAFEPAGFLDVYQFPTCPDIAQIVIAVNGKCRGMGVARQLVDNLMKENLHEKFNFKVYYWTAHTDNVISQNLALGAGFTDTNTLDRYGRKVFIKKVKPDDISVVPFCSEGKYESTNQSIITESAAIFFEADSRKLDSRIGRFLYKERIRNDKEIILMYDRVKSENELIKRTYLKLPMYKRINTFIDLSYYHGIFLRRNTFRMDNGINLYMDFLGRLLNNNRISNQYPKRTVLIPVKSSLWCDDADLMDYKKNINPISLFIRLIRTDPGRLRGLVDSGVDVLFVGQRGYFRMDLDTFDVNNLNRFKNNISKLLSTNEPIVDDYEIDDSKDSAAAIANMVIDKIEMRTGITISNIKSARVKPNDMDNADHLRIFTKPMAIDKHTVTKDNGIVIISIDPDGPNGFKGLNRTALSGVANSVDMYCKI